MTLAQHAAIAKDMVPHLDTLIRLARGCEVIVELGVRTGVSSWAFLEGLPPYGSLVSVDQAWHPDIPAEIANDPRWTFIQGDDRTHGIQERLPHADLWLIDTTHEYHHTLEELALAARFTRRILLHDFALPDVADAVRGFVDRTDWRIVRIEPSQWGLVEIVR